MHFYGIVRVKRLILVDISKYVLVVNRSHNDHNIICFYPNLCGSVHGVVSKVDGSSK